ncbi:MAG: transporter, partial [Flavipsychrobacter sp.]|nr:transporter [Flavipsychrobacter sp.]
FTHLLHTVAKKDYRIGFLATALLSIGGFMMMPFGTAFAINNLHITTQQLPVLFMVSGVSSLIIMPLVGKISDKIDKFKIFAAASVWMIIVVICYTHLSTTPLWLVMIFNICMMIGIMSRMIPSSALTTGIPEMKDRGAFMSINSSLQSVAGGVAAAIGGMIVVQKDKFSPLEHYTTLGYVVSGVTIVAIFLVYRVDKMVKRRLHESKA